MIAERTHNTQGKKMHDADLIESYAERLRPLSVQARKANGLRTLDTPAHEASREYTRLLQEYYEKGGSLVAMAKELGVAYSGLRRRVYLSSTISESTTFKVSRATQEEVDAAVRRVKRAKAAGVQQYHAQLATEYYDNNISLGKIARGLGISNASPLYYGAQRHIKRKAASK